MRWDQGAVMGVWVWFVLAAVVLFAIVPWILVTRLGSDDQPTLDEWRRAGPDARIRQRHTDGSPSGTTSRP